MARKKSSQSDEYKSLLREYRKLAKKADQRLVRLEKIAGQKNFKHIKDWAYAKAMKAISHWSGKDAARFNTKPPATAKSLRTKISDIKDFLGSVTSTKSGTISMYKRRADTLNKNHGTNFKWEDIGDFFESASYEKNEKEYGSRTYVMAIGEIQNNEDAILEAIEAHRDVNLKIENKKVKSTVNDLISKYGLGVVDLY